jgi:hypothetical protein
VSWAAEVRVYERVTLTTIGYSTRSTIYTLAHVLSPVWLFPNHHSCGIMMCINAGFTPLINVGEGLTASRYVEYISKP